MNAGDLFRSKMREEALRELSLFGVRAEDVSEAEGSGQDLIVKTQLNGIPIAVNLIDGLGHRVWIRGRDGTLFSIAAIVEMAEERYGFSIIKFKSLCGRFDIHRTWIPDLTIVYLFSDRILDKKALDSDPKALKEQSELHEGQFKDYVYSLHNILHRPT